MYTSHFIISKRSVWWCYKSTRLPHSPAVFYTTVLATINGPDVESLWHWLLQNGDFLIQSCPCSWVHQGASCTSSIYTFPAPDLESAIFLWSLVSFNRKSFVRTTIWILCMLIPSGWVIASSFFSRHNIHLYQMFVWEGRCVWSNTLWVQTILDSDSHYRVFT